MISYLLVVEQHRTQIVIHALLKCQQENLYHEQNVRFQDRKSGSAGMPRPISYAVFCLKKKRTLERLDPTTGEVLAEFPVAGASDVDDAVRAAKLAFPAWKRVTADRRRSILAQVAATLREHEAELKQISALETGTPIAMSRLAQAIDYFFFF